MDNDIQITLIKQPDGNRLLRLEQVSTGLSLEKRLDLNISVASQKDRWFCAFKHLLERELAAV